MIIIKSIDNQYILSKYLLSNCLYGLLYLKQSINSVKITH